MIFKNFITRYFYKNNYINDMQEEEKENNLHIKKYFDNYLKSDKSEFGVLLTAKWGSGKTFFIDKYIENYIKDSKKEKCKFIKISLFGINDLRLIDEKIFQQLHPVLGNKYVKFAGNIIKNGVKFGIPNIDIYGDSKSDLNLGFDTKYFDNYFSKSKSKDIIVFIFDDLERTNLNYKLFLGYIDSILEELNYKIIILADESKITDKEYIEFKEKIIGKTFELQQENIHSIIKKFIEEYSNNTKNVLNENIEILIEDVDKNNDSINLRIIKQNIMAFENFFESLEDKFLENKEFTKQLIKNYFILSKELKTRTFNNQEENEKLRKESFLDILKRNKINQHIFDNDIWSDILIKNYLDKDILKAKIENTTYFIEEKQDTPSWNKLWYFKKLNDDEFNIAFEDMKDKFIKNNYTNISELLHVVALLIFFYKKELSEYSIDSIQKQIDRNISLFKNKQGWEKILLNKNDLIYGGFGLGYINSNDEDFVKIHNKILKENEEYLYNQKVLKDKEELELFIKSIKDGDEEYLKSFFSKKYADIPILKDLDATKFINVLDACPNKMIQLLGEILSLRYSDNYRYNGQIKYCHFLIKEKDFWIKLNELFDNYKYDENKKLKNYMIKNHFNKVLIQNTIDKFEKCNNSEIF